MCHIHAPAGTRQATSRKQHAPCPAKCGQQWGAHAKGTHREYSWAHSDFYPEPDGHIQYAKRHSGVSVACDFSLVHIGYHRLDRFGTVGAVELCGILAFFQLLLFEQPSSVMERKLFHNKHQAGPYRVRSKTDLPLISATENGLKTECTAICNNCFQL